MDQETKAVIHLSFDLNRAPKSARKDLDQTLLESGYSRDSPMAGSLLPNNTYMMDISGDVAKNRDAQEIINDYAPHTVTMFQRHKLSGTGFLLVATKTGWAKHLFFFWGHG
jgi:hypothetical protein